MYIERQLEPELVKHLSKKEYTIITGARQTGKTTLLKRLYSLVKQRQKVAAYISFEDLDVLNRINRHPEEVFAFLPRPARDISSLESNEDVFFLFIDEIQYADNPTNFLKYLYDTYQDGLKIVATGSSAFYIDRKFKDSLVGRKRIFELKTLNFKEWLLFQGKKDLIAELELIRQNKDYISTRKVELLELFNKYIIFGGYPRISLEHDDEEKILLLKEIKNSYLKRDIVDSGIVEVEKFYLLFTLLAARTGNLLNKNKLAKTIGIDNKTVDKFIFALRKSFHISLVKPFHSNIRKEIIKMPKLYFNDTGLRNAVLNRYYAFDNRDDRGALFENHIYRRLTDLYSKDDIFFWRTVDNREIDFVVRESFDSGRAYEVKLNCNKDKIHPPKVFARHYPGFSFEVVSYDLNDNCKWFLKL